MACLQPLLLCGPKATESSKPRCRFESFRLCVPPDEDVCPCPKIPPVNLAETPVLNCSQIGKTFRYTCKEGYMREAGTSNRITCIKDGNTVKWTDSSLRCKCKAYLFLLLFYLIIDADLSKTAAGGLQ